MQGNNANYDDNEAWVPGALIMIPLDVPFVIIEDRDWKTLHHSIILPIQLYMIRKLEQDELHNP